MFIRRFRKSDAEKVSQMIIRTERITNSKDYSEEWINAFEKRVQPSVAAQSVLIGAAKPRAVCSIFLFYLNIKAKV